MKKKLKQLKLPYQVQIDDVVARSGFVVGTQGVEAIIQEGNVALVQRRGRPDLLFSGNFIGVVAE